MLPSLFFAVSLLAALVAAEAVTIRDVNFNPIQRTVTVQGIVVADKRGEDSRDGFYLQMTKRDASKDLSHTGVSDAIFVFCGSGCVDSVLFAEGSLVRITGESTTYYGNPQIVQKQLTSEYVEVLCNIPTIPVNRAGLKVCEEINIPILQLPVESLDDYIPYKGMLVGFQDELSVTGLFDLKFGTIALSVGGPLLAETMVVRPGTEVASVTEANALRMLKMDDGLNLACPPEQIWPIGGPNSLRVGYKLLTDVLYATSVIQYEYNHWTLIPTTYGTSYIPANFDHSENPRVTLRKAVPVNKGKNIRIAGLNVENYFIDFRDTCSACRGADNQEEFDRQQRKIFHSIKTLDAAIFSLQEVQQNLGDKALASLVSDLNVFLGTGKSYAYIDTGAVGGDVIKSAIIYQPTFVEPVGPFATLEFTNPSDKSRPAIAQTFRVIGGTDLFTIVVNHLKSKGSKCREDKGSRTNQLDGEGNCGYARLTHARQLMAWLSNGNPTGEATDKYFIMGDLNSHRYDRSIEEIASNSFINLADRDIAEPWSYNFKSARSTLDYMFISPGITCTNTTEWHINSDETLLIDYNDGQYRYPTACQAKKPEGYFNMATPFRGSDHDPIVSYCTFA